MKFTFPLNPTVNPLSDTSNCNVTYSNGFLYLKNSSGKVLCERACTVEEHNYLYPTFIKRVYEIEPIKKYTEAEIYERVNQLLIDARNIGINLNITTTIKEE